MSKINPPDANDGDIFIVSNSPVTQLDINGDTIFNVELYGCFNDNQINVMFFRKVQHGDFITCVQEQDKRKIPDKEVRSSLYTNSIKFVYFRRSTPMEIMRVRKSLEK